MLKRLRSLSITQSDIPYDLPPLPALQFLRIDHEDCMSSLSSSLPSLTTLSIPGFDLYDDNEYLAPLVALLPQLQYLHLADETLPLVAATVLYFASSLKTLKLNLWCNDTTRYDLSQFPEIPDDPAPFVNELDLSLTCTETPIGPPYLEGIRRLLFEYRPFRIVRITIYSWRGPAFKEDVLAVLRREWQGEGTTVTIRRADIS